MSLSRAQESASAGVARWRVGKVDIGRIADESVRDAIKHDVLGLAAEIAFRSSLAAVPFLVVLATLPLVIGTLFAVPDLNQRLTQEARSLFSESFGDTVDSLLKEVSQTHGWTALVVGITGTLLAGSSTTSSIRKALNRIYSFDEKTPFPKRKLREVALTVAVDVLAFCAFLAVVIGPNLLGEALGPLRHVVAASAAFLLLVLAVSLIYWLAPAAENEFKWITPGASLFALVWIGFSFGFGFYLSDFYSLNQFYGFLGIVIVLLIWLYWSAIALLLGAEVNSAVARRFEPAINAQRVPTERRLPG